MYRLRAAWIDTISATCSGVGRCQLTAWYSRALASHRRFAPHRFVPSKQDITALQPSHKSPRMMRSPPPSK